MKPCPLCGTEPLNVIYLGLPMKLCPKDTCNCLYGFWAWFAIHFQVEDGGWGFMTYEGSYWKALWTWMWNPPDEDE